MKRLARAAREGGIRFFIGWLLLLLFSARSGTAAQSLVLRGHVPPGLSRLQSLGAIPSTNHLSLVLGLPLRDATGLANFLQELYKPDSPNYRHYLTPNQFAARFAPTERDYKAVQAFAVAHGLEITATHPNRTLLDVRGSVEAIEKAFQVTLRRYPHPTEARTFFAPDTDPMVDATVPLLSVEGLDDFNLPRPMARRVESFPGFDAFPPIPLSDRSLAGNQAGGTPWLETGSGPRASFLGADFRAAYAPGLTLDGSGQSVGLFELGGYYPSDVFTYEMLAGLPNVPLTNVLVNGFNGSPGSANIEVALDIDMAIAMAPALSQVFVYEGSSALDVLNRMATDNLARQLSCSWGFGKPSDPTRDQIFLQFATQGQTMFQASGDDGAYAGTAMPPSDNPFLTVVGGTSLVTISPGGAWVSESAWNGSGGGSSTVYPLPSWQQGLPPSTNQASATMRNFPDVACLADGVIWLVANNGEQSRIGGTSAAAPLWAGFAALINQQAAQQGQPPVGFLNPALYALGQGPAFSAAFHDIVSGNNTNSASPTKFFATPGYDLCTGWGSPAGGGLLAGLNAPAPLLHILPEAPAAFAGTVSGPFTPLVQTFSLTNAGGPPLNWAVGFTDTWLTVSPLSGSINPGAPATILNVTLNPAAAALPSGRRTATLWFTNLNEGSSQSRKVTLDISPPLLTPPTVSLDLSYSFTGQGDGAGPNGLLEAVPGRFYGTTQTGGPGGAGVFFQFATNGGVLPLHALQNGTDGSVPLGTLSTGPDGRLYGTAFEGGVTGNGTVFSTDTNGNFQTLFSFGYTNGSLLFAGLTPGVDGKFYGVTSQGGANRRGTVFMLTTNGALTALYAFTGGSDGGFPRGQLASGPNGNLYGTTYKGGAYGYGSVFRIATNGFLTTLVSFNLTNGAFPSAGLLHASDGNFYGTTCSGGGSNSGVVFMLTPAGGMAVLHHFAGADGAAPFAALTEASDGGLYGSTTSGGAYGNGTLFRITPDGQFFTLAHFNGFNGAQPQAPLLQAGDGALYGSTRTGGAYGRGALFKVSLAGPPQIVAQPASQSAFVGANVSLSVVVSGASPFSFQWQRYGTNLLSQSTGPSIAARTLLLTNVSLADAGPYSVQITNPAGVTNSVTAFLQVTSSAPFFVSQPANQTVEPGRTATFSVVVLGNEPIAFRWQANGANLVDHGNLFGAATDTLTLTNVTEANNATYSVLVSNSLGSLTSTGAVLTVVPISAPGTRLVTLHGFDGDTDGGAPNGLCFATNGLLYGTTQTGGPRLFGTAFSLSTNGGFNSLIDFGGTNGMSPKAGLLAAADGQMYGTTSSGGAFAQGTAFRLTPAGAVEPLATFAGNSAGGTPVAALIQASDDNLYGTASTGGAGFGTVFRLALDGTLSSFYSFTNGTDGAFPAAPLVQAADGNFYGVTASTNSYGNIFKLTPTGTFTTLYSFTGGPDGSAPNGPLVQGVDGQLYGITAHSTLRGFQFYGTLFKISTNGVFSSVYLLNAGDGAYSAAGLIQGSDGNFYGTTHDGGANGNGTLFRLAPNGAFATLVQFDGFNDGAHPAAPLLEGAGGAIYGTTSSGGPGGKGTVFKLTATSAPQITAPPANLTAAVGGTVTFSVAVFGAAPLSYQWRQNGTNLTNGIAISGANGLVLTLSQLSPANGGTYSVTVSNALGGVLSPGALLTVVTPPVFQGISRTNATLYLSWSAIPGQHYQLQFKPSLTSTSWSNLGNPLSATNTLATATDTIGSNAQRFYRVLLQPQP